MKEKWKYKNIGVLIISILIGILLAFSNDFKSFLLNLGDLGYIGALIGGALFVSIFTSTTGAIILLILAESYPILPLAVVAGIGGVLGDLLIFRFIKDNLINEIKLLEKNIESKFKTIKENRLSTFIERIIHTRYFHWLLPIVGALIIASPLPDEMGISLMGISKISTLKFIAITFLLNSLGLVIVLSASLVIKP